MAFQLTISAYPKRAVVEDTARTKLEVEPIPKYPSARTTTTIVPKQCQCLTARVTCRVTAITPLASKLPVQPIGLRSTLRSMTIP